MEFPPFTNLLLGADDSQEHECWCVTHQRPKVEFHQIFHNDFNELKQELSVFYLLFRLT